MPDAAPDAERVGIILPTFNRPDLARACVLQMAAQSRVPDVICVHQNGHPQSYEWAVSDLEPRARLIWIHTPQALRQHDWYAIPLACLIEHGCTRFFWTDHDDLYLRSHIAEGLAELQCCDFSVSNRCGMLFTRAADFRFRPGVEVSIHAPGGMSSTMCFNRDFAQALHHDLTHDSEHHYADHVVAHVTMPRFRCIRSGRETAIYHSHEGSLTSHAWVGPAFGDPRAPDA